MCKGGVGVGDGVAGERKIRPRSRPASITWIEFYTYHNKKFVTNRNTCSKYIK